MSTKENGISIKTAIGQVNGPYSEIYAHFVTQSQDPIPGETTGGHPDAATRNANKAWVHLIKNNREYAALIKHIIDTRPTLGADHLVDVAIRSIQYVLREIGITDYKDYSPEKWIEILENLAQNKERFELYKKQLETRNAATHIPDRYIALKALCAAMGSQIDEPLNIGDLGCSVNYGLPAIMHPGYLPTQNGASFNDELTGGLITRLFESNTARFGTCFGADSHLQDEKWAAACAYLSMYEASLQKLKRAKEALAPEIATTPLLQLNAISPEFADQVKRRTKTSQYDILHASMMTYMLKPEEEKALLCNAQKLLRVGGAFLELDFKNRKNWFLEWNIESRIRFKTPNGLTDPFVWFTWSNSRCRFAKVKDEHYQEFESVNKLLGISA